MGRVNPFRIFSGPSTLNPRPLFAVFAWGIVTVAFCCLTAGFACAQTIYKYTDKNGVMVLTDKPPKGVSAEPVVSGKPAAANSSGEEIGAGRYNATPRFHDGR